jgi:hypothetical protein
MAITSKDIGVLKYQPVFPDQTEKEIRGDEQLDGNRRRDGNDEQLRRFSNGGKQEQQ